ncbi:low temperature requirement protein A [Paenibacillus terreus]|uniref:Low temperature requirement protein A n=1 Tax=Paenibacillus terreus TaxID=1387834 RepID=A0ABV5B750_9BACL
MAEKKVTWLELFYDLLFVAAVSKATHVLLHAEHGIIPMEYLFKFILIFVPIWWGWVGQTLFINRFGQDTFIQRILIILQLFFVLIMTASLSPDFDQYYIPFFIGYIGSRALTAIQYFWAHRAKAAHQQVTASYLGKHFLFGILISTFSLFFDSWIRYAILYLGIAVDIVLPLIGRRHLVKTPINTHHLFERFALFTLILLGESVISILAVLQFNNWEMSSVLFIVFTALLVIAMWWQYFDNIETKVSKDIQTAGQTIIYGHLFVYLSLSMIAASIQLLYLEQLDYSFMLIFVFGSVLLYFLSTSLVFHRYRHKHLRLKPYHWAVFVGIIACFITFDLIYHVPSYAIVGEIMVFFVAYAKLTA